MRIAFQDLNRAGGCRVCLEIIELGLWSCSEGKKNSLRRLRARVQDILRPQDAARARSLVRGYASVPGGGVPARGVWPLWSCEAGEAGLDCRQSAVHEKVCFLCGEAMPGVDAERRSQGTALGLAYSQGTGDAIHAGATPPGGDARTAGDWEQRRAAAFVWP